MERFRRRTEKTVLEDVKKKRWRRVASRICEGAIVSLISL